MRWISRVVLLARAAISHDARKTCSRLLAATVFLIALTPGLSWACACGCGVYEVGTASLFPTSGGGTVWFEYDFQDQYLNWHATHIASAGANSDKVIRSHFLTLGAQYMFNRKWGVMVEVPYWYRYFKTTTDSGQIHGFNFNSIGDIRIEGMYTGLSEDMSSGLLGGVKVPSGWWHYPHADRDTQIGTGSTDLLLGALAHSSDEMTHVAAPSGASAESLMQRAKNERDRELSECRAKADGDNAEISARERDEYALQAKQERDRASLISILTTSQPR
jgi:hypothetical protein